jgi:uncharacterized protein YkwD
VAPQERQREDEPSFVPSVKRALVLAASVLAAVAAAPAQAQACRGADDVVTAETRAAAQTTIRCLITRERTSRGLRRLRPNADLREAAEGFAATLVRRGEFDHVIPGVPDLGGRLRQAGYARFAVAGENLAWAGGELATPRTIVRSWMGSPGHRANVLRRDYREVGIGVAMGTPEGGDGITVASGFGTRR